MNGQIISIIIALIAAFGGSWGFWEAIAKRKWTVKDRTDEILNSIATIKEENKKNIDATKADLENEITNVSKELAIHVRQEQEEAALATRARIVRIAREINEQKPISDDEFNNIMEDITKYEKYCRNNPGFVNNKAQWSIDIIEEAFKNPHKKELS